jgi:aminoglycoside phosphotransferase (APT) family kinase protein
LARAIDPASTLLRCWPLAGGVSAQTVAMELRRGDGRTIQVVVRQHGEADRRRNPDVAAAEFRLLGLLQEAGLPAPRPLYLDRSGEALGTPCIVVEFIAGENGRTAASGAEGARQLADNLAALHRVHWATVDLSFLPEKRCTGMPGEGAAGASTGEQRNPPVLLHGDYWPGNTLWRAGRLVAILDWEDAAVGDPLADVANARLEILWAWGAAAMEAFTRHYRAAMPGVDFTGLPHWDLCAGRRLAPHIGEWGLGREVEERMRQGYRWFVRQAISKMAP